MGAFRLLLQEAEEELDDRAEHAVDGKEEDRQDDGQDDDHDRSGQRLLARRPDDLAALDADLADEFAGGDFGHDVSSCFDR